MLSSSSARAVEPEPWSDNDPAEPPRRLELGDYGFRGGAEYRSQALWVNPVNLSSEKERRAAWLEQRLRLDGAVDWQDKVRITTSIDILDGVLWGDNGSLGTAPEPANGAHINTNNPNVAKPCITYAGTGNKVSPDAYHYGLCPADPLLVRRLYGDVMTPIGLVRIGRQPFTAGASVALNDGDGRRNRFGVSNRGNSADRILFATKPLEAFKSKDMRNASEHEGAFLILAYDRLVNDQPQVLNSNLHSWATAIRVLAPGFERMRDVELRLFHAYRWDTRFDTNVHAIGGRATARLGNFYGGFDAVGILGSTREVSEAFHLITNDPAVSQSIRQMGARAVVRYDQPTWTAYLESDYASGSSDTTLHGPLTQFRFAEDSNVGLLLFKQIFAYQTGREAAAATSLLQSLGAPTIPVESIATRGAMTNAFVLFPQFDFKPIDSVLLRAGVMFAWAAAPVFDPIASAQRHASGSYQSPIVNYAGGAPGSYYGTEVDVRAQWRLYDHFAFDLEGAILFPGSALEDEDHHAARSVLAQGRGTFFF